LFAYDWGLQKHQFHEEGAEFQFQTALRKKMAPFCYAAKR
jgi:hypothetical protein